MLRENGESLDDVTLEWGDIPDWDDIPHEENPPLLSDTEELDREFYPGFGLVRGRPFVAYTSRSIYFVHAYDGQETIRHIPRNPGSCRKPRHYDDYPGYRMD
ncbi:MAG: hypothetical protein OXH47_03415 [Paracoccaceae bacterium]|nr:hypothetical protein [Paracoccaceae bacterium]